MGGTETGGQDEAPRLGVRLTRVDPSSGTGHSLFNGEEWRPIVATVPAFSHFSAASELVVSAGVFYFFWRAMKHDSYRWAFIWIVIAFETLINITYMISRLANHAPSPDYPAWATWLLAGHGLLSLVMFVGLIWMVVEAYRRIKVTNTNYFRTNVTFTWVFLALWCTSVLSGEAIYLLQLSDHLAV